MSSQDVNFNDPPPVGMTSCNASGSFEMEPNQSRPARRMNEERFFDTSSNANATERTPLITNYLPHAVNGPDASTFSHGSRSHPKERTISVSPDSGHSKEEDEDEEEEKWSHLRLAKTICLSLVIVFALAAFILVEEKHESWGNVAVKRDEPVYINLSNKLDLLYPVWTVKAKAAFLPKEYANLSDYDVFFSVVKIGDDSQHIARLKDPWIVPVAPVNLSQAIGLREVSHGFLVSSGLANNDARDDFFNNIYDENYTYQLEIATNEEKAVPISISVSGYSELSLKGIIMAGAVLIFLYVLIIFEVVHRTLAAIIGATAAIACLTIIRDRPSLDKVISWLDTETLCLLFGMMIMVAILCETGFFDYVAVLAFRLAKGQIWPLVIILCLFTGFLSAFLDNVTTILLMTPVTIRLCEIKNIDPKHVLIAQVIFSNIGGAATPVGDPPNVIIISSPKIKQMGVDFVTFTFHLMPGVLVCIVAAIFMIRILYRDVSKLRFPESPETAGKCRRYVPDEDDYLLSFEKEKKRLKAKAKEDLLKASARNKSCPVFEREVSQYYENIQLHTSCNSRHTKSFEDLDVDTPRFAGQSFELKHEIDVWKKACNSISGYSRDENSVRKVLKRKVHALEHLLKKHLYDVNQPLDDDFKETLAELKTKYKIKNKPLLIKSGIVLGIVIALFFLQGIPQLDLSLGWIAILGATALLILADFDDLESIIGRVEWSTLIFFAALFVVMEALEELQFLWWIGQLTQQAINSVDEENRLIMAIVLILWVSALSSSFIDNIPFATVMVKIVEDLADDADFNLPMTPLVYALAFGACLGGNGTLIGASANVVCAGVAEQHGYRFTFMDFFKIGFPIMLVTVGIANVYLIICHVVFQWN